MKPLPEMQLAPNIAAAQVAVEVAKLALSKEVAEAQGGCQHQIVSEAPYYSAGLPAWRICNHCRLQEEGSHWSGGATWSRHDFGNAVLGNVNGRVVVTVDRDAFYKMRVS